MKKPIHTRFAKRAFDMCFSIFALIGLAPVLIGIALAVKLSSRGPVFLTVRRVGINGKPIGLLRFRTMYTNHKDSYLTTPVRTAKEDPRVTKVGAFLRRTSLYMLPQFMNVLKGDISVVGPMPLLEFDASHLTERQAKRMKAKPGIVGLWQVYNRSSSLEDMIAIDLDYLARQSFLLDLKILWRAVVLSAAQRNAY
ncbi:sugar transferase [Paraburkholderia aspalathi]|uniref:sugar transferase n=1 Tax=Paraburkholderia aspalathi TaxID=1324617 RepID=UPI001B0F8933|nr:sugar transferase [Paraburkholderia aspalathi]CAE6708343.1 UDP-glucose:undecaprenyl-phosphate glucose-1-phosphate transferase [Paraburkholderia aspalathi]